MELKVEVEQAVAVEERGRGGRAEEELEVRQGRRRSQRLKGRWLLGPKLRQALERRQGRRRRSCCGRQCRNQG